MTEEETHPWKWFAPDDSQVLIVGTFPTAKRNWHYDFFYPNTANLFWNVMARVAEIELKYFSGDEAVSERKNILRKLKAAVTDMGLQVIRSDKSSLDENLAPLKYMNIFRILDENPSIRKILFTSSSGKVSASKWFGNFLKEQNIQHKFPKEKKPIRSFIQYNNRQIELVILYSTSPRAANRVSFDKLAEMYKIELKEINQW